MDDVSLVKLIEVYATAIVELRVSRAEKFIDAFARHLELADARDEPAWSKRPRIR
jgi:hypothetical protein